jgi:Tfp pilus assembly protein PilF
LILLTLALSLMLAGGCRTDPNVAKHQYLQSGQRFMEQGKYQQAEIQFRNALKIDPRFADAYLQLSKPAIATAHWQDALGDLKRALQLDPNLTEARLAISRLYLSAARARQRRSSRTAWLRIFEQRAGV